MTVFKRLELFSTDARADRRAEAYDDSVERICPRLGETGTGEEIIALLGQPLKNIAALGFGTPPSMCLHAARHFGRFHVGNTPGR